MPDEVGINKISETGEYKIYYRQGARLVDGKLVGGRYNENLAYYTNSELDAALTLINIAEQEQRRGNDVWISNSKLTQSVLSGNL